MPATAAGKDGEAPKGGTVPAANKRLKQEPGYRGVDIADSSGRGEVQSDQRTNSKG